MFFCAEIDWRATRNTGTLYCYRCASSSNGW